MALYNEILVGRFARGIQKYFGAKGSPPIKQLAGDLYIVHKLFNGAENRYLEGWSRFGWVAGQAAAVGNKSAVRLRNPPTSNVIAVIERISCSLASLATKSILAARKLPLILVLSWSRSPDKTLILAKRVCPL